MTNRAIDSMDDLARRLALLEDEQGILRTLYQYGHSIDYALHDQYVDCFTEDAVLEHRRRLGMRPSERIQGRAALAANAVKHKGPPTIYHKYLVLNPLITVTGAEATVESYWARLNDGTTAPFIWAFGRYRDQMVKCADGKWRFKERVIDVEGRAKV